MATDCPCCTSVICPKTRLPFNGSISTSARAGGCWPCWADTYAGSNMTLARMHCFASRIVIIFIVNLSL
jgi:hypothetical protein